MSRRAAPLALALAGAVLAAAPAPARAEEGAFTRGALGGRAYRLYVPARAAAGPLPLVVALHGCWQTPEDFALGTRLNDAAERRGLLVLYPAQGHRDNVNRCWNWFEPAHQARAAGEVAEILALVREVARAHRVAPGRTMVLGISAGGFMAVNLFCAAPDVVRGVGVVAGGPYRCGLGPLGALQCMRGFQLDGAAAAAACLRAAGSRPLAVRASLWQGAQDTVVAPANLNALETMFARLAGAASGVIERQDGALRALYRDGAGRPVLETWLVPGLGHAWSGGDPRGTHASPLGPSATDRMLDFLLE
jgi:poly(hydroxyalkanoate) depolymerase family esterase